VAIGQNKHMQSDQFPGRSMKRHNITTATILLTGCIGALVIYVTAVPQSENPFEEFEHSKRFTRSVEVMGGKMSLVANDMSKWFSSLWQGEQLAFTVVIITVVIAAAYYLIASGRGGEI
jgi:hypothetical protein